MAGPDGEIFHGVGDGRTHTEGRLYNENRVMHMLYRGLESRGSDRLARRLVSHVRSVLTWRLGGDQSRRVVCQATLHSKKPEICWGRF